MCIHTCSVTYNLEPTTRGLQASKENQFFFPTLNIRQCLCQGTLFFSNISAVYSSPSAAFCFTSLHYPSMTSAIISEYFCTYTSTVLSSLYLFIILFFAFLLLPLDRLPPTSRQTLPMTPVSIFIFIFISISDVIMSHLLSWGSYFPFTYCCRLPSSRSLSFSLRISC